MRQVSAELRWFLDANHATEVHTFTKWFAQGPYPPGGGRLRTDVYSIDPTTIEIGVKDRGGKPGLEIKVLVDDQLSSMRVGTRTASTQLWSKVTSQIIALPVASEKRTTTHKWRSLRKFELVGDAVEEVELGAGALGEDPKRDRRPDLGCNVEWTHVEVPGHRDAWTFGLEAFAYGAAAVPLISTLERALSRTIDALGVRNSGVPVLDERWHELSYPAWLRGIER